MKKFEILYKINAIKNLLKIKPDIIEKVYVIKNNKKTLNLIKLLTKKNIKIFKIKNIQNKKLDYIKKDYNAIAKIKIIKKYDINECLTKKNITILILDRIQDPCNLGSCIRTAEAFNIDLIIVSKKNTTKLSSLIHSISNAGSLIIPIIYYQNIKNVISIIKEHNINVVSLSAQGKYELTDIKKPIAIIMGSEKNGVKEKIKNLSSQTIKIKMLGKCNSINVSVATGITLSKIKN